MNWLRSKAKRLSLLALFALALQLGLSFGHTHLDRAFAGTAAISDQAIKSTPDQNRDHDTRNDLCAICATISLSNALIDSVPPILPLPLVVRTADTMAFEPTHVISTPALGFQSRAPPRS